MSSLKESEEQTSPPATPGSLGVHVASSHFSNTSASRGKSGLGDGCERKYKKRENERCLILELKRVLVAIIRPLTFALKRTGEQ
ncbi:hypothetical protein Baya_6100 [Bagarius yarrelli]|uniref:Uncharacterized protein n=1 Tax=Bagarius yarrelli TaxID=175774 RepID=A0A556U4Z8_BAGYA|nr:hypothetical protein Baya_6100 [Bagarius yarrelli]